MAGSETANKVPNKPGGLEERRLIEAAQQDRTRFADLYDKHFELVYAYVSRRVQDRSATEDLTAEVFHKALANLARFKWTGAPFAAWLFRIASNLIADRAKRAAREAGMTLDESRLAPESREPSLTAGVPPRDQSNAIKQSGSQPQQTDLEDSERRAELFRMIEELMPDQRRVVLLRFVEERSIREIASDLGRSEGAVKQLQFRALEHLRKRIRHLKHGATQSDEL